MTPRPQHYSERFKHVWPKASTARPPVSNPSRPGQCFLAFNRYPAVPPQKAGGAPKFSAHVCGQTDGWIKIELGTEVGLSTGDFLVDGDPVPLSKKGAEPVPNFQPISIVDKRLDASRCHFVWK